MDPTIKAVLEGAFAERANVNGQLTSAIGQVAGIIAAGNAFAAEHGRLQYLTHNATINATAIQVLMGNKLSQDILAQNSARDQPGQNKGAA